MQAISLWLKKASKIIIYLILSVFAVLFSFLLGGRHSLKVISNNEKDQQGLSLTGLTPIAYADVTITSGGEGDGSGSGDGGDGGDGDGGGGGGSSTGG